MFNPGRVSQAISFQAHPKKQFAMRNGCDPHHLNSDHLCRIFELGLNLSYIETR